MEEDEAAQDPTRGRPEENDIGVRTRREAGEHAVDSRILGHVRPERDGNLPLAFQGPGQRGRGTVRRRQAAHGEFPSDPRLDGGGGARVVYLSPADKYHRFTRRLSKGQKV